MDQLPPLPQLESFEAELKTLLGPEHVETAPAERAFFSTDVFRRADIDAALVLSPGTEQELAAAIAICARHNVPMVPRGGGLSYTGGFLPTQARTALIDMRRLDAIIEVNEQDMYVTVECGATWKSLYEKLKPLGLRTPYFGPMSGYASSIGGALSQGSVFLGSTQYGTTADSVLSLRIVLADGTILDTGSAGAMDNKSPFFRHYGPDLTGLFLHDSGALGFKTRATLRLIKTPAAAGFASFTFPTHAELLAAMSEISRRGLAAECFGADPYIWGMRLWDEDFSRDTKRLIGIVKSAPSLLKGVLTGARAAIKGRQALSDVTYAMNVAVDGNSQAAVAAALTAIRAIAARGREIDATVPAAIRGTPFLEPNDLLGPKGHRWSPSHAIVPHSRAVKLVDDFKLFLEARRENLTAHGIECGFVAFAISTNAILFEPMFYWPGARLPYHERMISPAYLAKLPNLPANPAADAAMRALREDLAKFWAEQGAAHLQIGKTYRYAQTRAPAFLTLLNQIKAAVDPNHLVNPGALGLP